MRVSRANARLSVDDRTEEKPKVGLFRRLFGGGSAAPEAAPSPPAETTLPLPPTEEAKPSAAPFSPPLEPTDTLEAPAAPIAPVEAPTEFSQPTSPSEAEPPKASGVLGRWFGRGEETPSLKDDTPAAPEPPKRSWLSRLTSGLARSSSALGRGIVDVFTKRKLDETSLDDLEDILIQADLGIGPATRIREAIGKGRYEKGIDPDEVKRLLAEEVERTLTPVAKPLAIDAARKPFVILVIGVNGSGKTTTIGKLAAKFAADGRKVLLAAGDTFRAAAIEQLRIWATRAKAEIVAREQGGDAAGLAFDAITKAKADGVDVMLMDTAGRLQNRAELMKELEKIIRVMKKVDAQAPHATLLVLDATVGQNALSQVEIFGRIAGVTGLVMTKLDGTARGGILVAIADKFKLPVHFIGVGEQMDDLEPFEARDFARAIAGLE
jgi:fused signal recognition particle receptor